MTLTPGQRTALLTSAAVVFGLFMSVAIAGENYTLSWILVAVTAAMALSWLQPTPFSTLVLGAGLLGYVLGNRGFAQLMLLRGLPILPGEWILLLCGSTLLLRSVTTKSLPWRNEPLNLAILAWMLFSSWRLYFDLKTFGFAALRDYATVYYAAFFFIGQNLATSRRSRKFLERCLFIGIMALPGLFVIYREFPGFFMDILTFRGIPLIFYKEDLVGTFIAAGAVLCFLQFESTRRILWLVAGLAFTGVMLTTHNRASMAGLGVATLLLCFGGRWKMASWQFFTALTASLVILLAANYGLKSVSNSPLTSTYEKVASFADPVGKRSYVSDEAADKGSNNLFRYVWWSTCIEETNHANPVFGLGWGYDLAGPFVRSYYPTGSDDFSARSPHNLLITIYSRSGLIGLLPFLFVFSLVFLRTWRAARDTESKSLGLWCICSVILTSACFGVVLEGPMGALPFWIALGLANAKPEEAEDQKHPIESVS